MAAVTYTVGYTESDGTVYLMDGYTHDTAAEAIQAAEEEFRYTGDSVVYMVIPWCNKEGQ